MQPPDWHEQDSFWETFSPHLFNQTRLDATQEEVDHLIKLAEIQPGMAVLDLPCGIGRHSCELARRGFQVTAVDRTQAYLRTARQLAAEGGLQIEFVQEDMRAFHRQEAFDVCLNLFSSFGYFEDLNEDRLVLQNFYRSLKPGGVLVMEMMGKEILARLFQPKSWQEEDEALFLVERKISSGWDWIENRWILIKDGERREFTLGHRLFSAVELSTLIQQAGFSQINVYGSLQGIPYNQDARCLVVVARK
jgi:SAM-dependent methyltransferase